MVHNDMLNKQLNDNNNNNSTDALPNLVNRPIDRRRPGRPPKPKVFFDEQIIPTTSRRKQSRQKKEDIIQCICDTPTDEFGAMVQCDDCLSWLHVDCLDLTKQDLEQSYRCPPCCVSLGSNNQLPKSMAWRYEAQMKSQRLAAINEISDDDDDDDDMDDDTDAMECDVVEQPLHVDNLKLPEPIRIDTNYCKDIRSRSTTPEDWPDVSSESHYSISSANTSEVSTPSEHTLCDPFEYQQIMSQGNLIIDIENFELLSRLAYLQKLKDDLFSPNATDVFLCEDNNSKHFISQPDISSQSTTHHESLPSTICSQELSEFSFDNGPFWQPLN
ncbi:hypothetical protein RMATCC62417_14328 [Rhizopus microsporus]|nr:hypothetical protein RMATCC62417_14328 [Rhizopus microsporus]